MPALWLLLLAAAAAAGVPSAVTDMYLHRPALPPAQRGAWARHFRVAVCPNTTGATPLARACDELVDGVQSLLMVQMPLGDDPSAAGAVVLTALVSDQGTPNVSSVREEEAFTVQGIATQLLLSAPTGRGVMWAVFWLLAQLQRGLLSPDPFNHTDTPTTKAK